MSELYCITLAVFTNNMAHSLKDPACDVIIQYRQKAQYDPALGFHLLCSN